MLVCAQTINTHFVHLSGFDCITKTKSQILSGALAELIPHLALFISLVGAFGSTALALVFPPVLDMLVSYAKRELTFWVWLKNSFLLMFALIGFFTGTYASIAEIIKAFGQPDPVDV
jgi:proton-coupled amino acid transporter